MCKETEMECPFCLMMKTFHDHPVGKHLRGALRESLVGFRKVLDAKIEALKDEEETQARKVNVE